MCIKLQKTINYRLQISTDPQYDAYILLILIFEAIFGGKIVEAITRPEGLET